MTRNFLPIFLLSLLMFCYSCSKTPTDKKNEVSETGKKNEPKLTTIKFDELEHNFGKIIVGEVVTWTVQFENTGKSDLIIHKAKASCGCTVPKWTNEPVEPGEKGSMDVRFDSGGRHGAVSKNVTVYANIPGNRAVVSFKAEIVEE